jgi:hypothetical protein
MKQKSCRVVFPSALFVLAVFVCAVFLANANLSFAETAKKKATNVTRMSAVEYTESQIKQLQEGLKITGEQTELWDNLTKVMRENAKDMDAMIKGSPSQKTMDALEHMKFHKQLTEAHLNQMNKFIPAFEALYNTMSDEQKSASNTLLRTGKHARHKKK